MPLVFATPVFGNHYEHVRVVQLAVLLGLHANVRELVELLAPPAAISARPMVRLGSGPSA
jgi:hypothetical protein